jgi:hypothetical protein
MSLIACSSEILESSLPEMDQSMDVLMPRGPKTEICRARCENPRSGSEMAK